MGIQRSVLSVACALCVLFSTVGANAYELIREEGGDGPDLAFSLGGALRFNYTVRSFDEAADNRRLGGEFLFDTFRLNSSLEYGILRFDAEYRFYAGYHMLHHGYLGIVPKECIEVQVGVMQSPFGITPYSSHNWFFDIGYYLGLEDDYDAGVKAIWTRFDPLKVEFAFFLNDEGSYSGSSLDSARYSYDLVRTNDSELPGAGTDFGANNRESNEGVLRLTYRLDHGGLGATEFGWSGKIGQIYNMETNERDKRWATQLHIDSTYRGFNLQLGATFYDFNPPNPEGVPDDVVVFGAYDFPYLVASSGTILLANIAYTLQVDRPVLDELTFYNDYSVLLKGQEDFVASHQNVTGVSILAGPLFTYVDFGFSKNHPFLGPNYTTSLAQGEPDGPWRFRFNTNLGVYF